MSSSKAGLPLLPLPPMSKIYNSSYKNNKPAELFRKDLISAMKLADSEPLEPDNYWLISDGWKQEWERGVQVPVNPDHLPLPLARAIKKRSKSNDFKLPPNKFLRCSHDEFFSNELHILTNVSALSEKTCRYDLDSLDQHWLKVFNEDRKSYGLEPLPELTMEIILEDFENQCFEKLQREIQAEQGLGIEYDEDVVCDVCRSPDSEEGNEMVFCDQCNLCVHQACYGIQRIPTGSWVCRTCALGIRPPCVLCPARGGAMKSTRSGQKWTHVSCALWVPEVSIGCVEKMEPITKISQIPPSRWALTCCLCRERMGACIQCSVKACKRAYHVTCAFENSLEMKAIIDESPKEEEVKLKSYCPKHSKKREVHRKEVSSDDSDKKASSVGPSREGGPPHHQREVQMTSEERDGARAAKIQAIESEFYKHVSVKETAEAVPADPVIVDFVFNYWTLKRKANHDKPLLTPLKEETDRLDKLEENSLYSRVKMFVHLRQDLERVRNLCYMVSRREKIAKSFIKVKEDIFEHQVAMLKPGAPRLSDRDREAVILAGQSEHIYDRLASHDPTGPKPCLRLLLEALEGREVANLYGLIKKPPSTPTRLPNPYAKQYVNGLRSRRLSLMGGESEGSLAPDDDSQGTAESTNAVRGTPLETLCEEPAEDGPAVGQAPLGSGQPAQEGSLRAGQQFEPAENASSPKQEARKDDHGSGEGRISTRSRKHEVATDAIKGASSEGARRQGLDDAERKAQTRSRRLGSVESLKGTCRGEARKDDVGDASSRTPTRSRRSEADEFVKSPSLGERKSELVDAGNGTSFASQGLDTAEPMQNSEAKKSEQKEPGRETPTRNRKCDTTNSPCGSRKAEPQREQVERESKALYRSRRHECKVEDPEEQVKAVLRWEAKREASREPESRSSSRSRRLDTKSEPPGEAVKTPRSKAGSDEIVDMEYKPLSARGRQMDLGAEVAEEEVKSPSRNDARKAQSLETECRMSSRSRRAEARMDGSNDRSGSETSKEVRKNSELENRIRTTRQSEARSDVLQAVKEGSENRNAAGEAEDESGRSRRLRNRRAGSIERREVVGQSNALAATCEIPEELSDVARCTRSSTMQRQEDGRGLGDSAPQGPAEGWPAGESKRSSDENVPHRSERRERRDSVPCVAMLPEALSPPRASSLSGYRIPKRAKAPNGLLDDCRGSSPVSPLHEVPSHCYSDGYTRGRSHVANLRRSASYVERWKHDLDFATAASSEVKENGSRYSMRYRPKCGVDS